MAYLYNYILFWIKKDKTFAAICEEPYGAPRQRNYLSLMIIRYLAPFVNACNMTIDNLIGSIAKGKRV